MAAQPPSPARRRAEMLCQLLDRDGPKLRSQARLHAQRPGDAEDALQDACVQFLRYYDGPPTDALRWMYVVVKRCAWAITRRASRTRELGYDVSKTDGDGENSEIIPSTIGPESPRRPSAARRPANASPCWPN